jgi:hypothetical protein
MTILLANTTTRQLLVKILLLFLFLQLEALSTFNIYNFYLTNVQV